MDKHFPSIKHLLLSESFMTHDVQASEMVLWAMAPAAEPNDLKPLTHMVEEENRFLKADT